MQQPAEVAAAPVVKPTATPYVASLAPVPRAAPAAAANLDMQFSGDSWVEGLASSSTVPVLPAHLA